MDKPVSCEWEAVRVERVPGYQCGTSVKHGDIQEKPSSCSTRECFRGWRKFLPTGSRWKNRHKLKPFITRWFWWWKNWKTNCWLKTKKRREIRNQTTETRITNLLLLAKAWVKNACCNSHFVLLAARACLKNIKVRNVSEAEEDSCLLGLDEADRHKLKAFITYWVWWKIGSRIVGWRRKRGEKFKIKQQTRITNLLLAMAWVKTACWMRNSHFVLLAARACLNNIKVRRHSSNRNTVLHFGLIRNAAGLKPSLYKKTQWIKVDVWNQIVSIRATFGPNWI